MRKVESLLLSYEAKCIFLGSSAYIEFPIKKREVIKRLLITQEKKITDSSKPNTGDNNNNVAKRAYRAPQKRN